MMEVGKRLMQENRSFIKKSAFLAVYSGMMIFLAGCWDRMEINDLAIVTATGIDKSDDGQVVLSLEIFIPKSMGGGNQAGGAGDVGGKTTLITYHKGRNVADALSKLQAEMPREIFWGSCRIFIFSEAVAKDGIQEHLDFLLRHPEPRERAFVFVSKGKAKKILDIKANLERYSAEVLREIANKGHGLGVTMQDLDEMLISKERSAVLPYLKIIKEKSDGKASKYAVLNGTVLFKRDRMVGTMSESTTRGLLWLKNKLKDYTVTFQLEKGDVSVYPVSTKVRMTPKIRNGEWKMIVSITTKGTVIQNTTNMNLDDPKMERKMEQAFQKRVENRIREAIKEAQDMNVDVVEYGKEFYRKYPKQWKKVEDRWEEVFPEVKTEIHVEAHIRRQGYIHQPVRGKER